MRPFEYARPESLDEAVRLLAEKPGATALAGGTDLLGLLKDDVERASRLVSLKGIPELTGITADPSGGLRIGALATLEELASQERIRHQYPSLVQAVNGIRSAQIRNMGTVGGDLCQRPRCWYYRHGYGLLAFREGSSMVRAGDNRYHAILGNSGAACFVNPSSLAPALIALEAEIETYGPRGSRIDRLERLFRTPVREGEREHGLERGEIVTALHLPASRARNATYEVHQKEGLDSPLAVAAVALSLRGSTIERARLVLGQVAPVPWRAAEAEKLLTGASLGEETARAAARAALAGATPLSGNAYKVRLAQVALRRALLLAAGKEVPA